MKRWLRFMRHWRNWLGVVLVVILAALALAAPSFSPQPDPANPTYFALVGKATNLIPQPPSETALLGTLPGQYDVFFTLVWGLRQAFKFGISVTLITASFGILYGAVSAYLGGAANNLMMRISDAFLTFPVLAAIVFMRQIIVIFLVGSGAFFIYMNKTLTTLQTLTPLQTFLSNNANPVMWSLVLLSWMPYSRLMNASVLRLRGADFVTSAKALGAGHSRIILRHLLPNAISPEIVLAARDIGTMVILEATFTFIGLGGKNYWGSLLAIGRDWVVGPGGNPLRYWWTYLPVTILLIIFGVSWNFLGDSLNDWLNPRKTA